jgi:hypothetical protein
MAATFTYTWQGNDGSDILSMQDWAQQHLDADELQSFHDAVKERDDYLKTLASRGVVTITKNNNTEIHVWPDKPTWEAHARRFLMWEHFANRCALDQHGEFKIDIQPH